MGVASGAAAQTRTGSQPVPERTAVLPRRAETMQGPAPESVDFEDDEIINGRNPDEFDARFGTYGDRLDYAEYDEHWKPPELLDAPEPRANMVQRWIAVMTDDKDDASNVSQRLAEGWKPRNPATCPDWNPPTVSDGNFQGCIGMRGMVLMERPKALHTQYQGRVRMATQRQMQHVKGNLLAVHQNGGPFKQPVMEQSQRVSRRAGVRPAEDED